jgi:hypothetical protein
MKDTRALQGKTFALLTFALATTSYPAAYALPGPHGERVFTDVNQGSTPALLFAQIPADSIAPEGSDLTPEAAGAQVQTTIQRGEAVSLILKSGRLDICAPLRIGGDQFTTTATYYLSAEENSSSQESPTTSQLENSQRSLFLPTELKVETIDEATDRELSCQPSGSSTSGESTERSNGQEPDHATTDLVLKLILEGNLNQISNAAAFLGSAIANKVSLDYAEAGANIAVTGVDYGLVTDLTKILSDMLTIDPSNPEYAEVKSTSLETAILLNNQIISDSSDTTISALAENPYFLKINDTLRYFRSQL